MSAAAVLDGFLVLALSACLGSGVFLAICGPRISESHDRGIYVIELCRLAAEAEIRRGNYKDSLKYMDALHGYDFYAYVYKPWKRIDSIAADLEKRCLVVLGRAKR